MSTDPLDPAVTQAKLDEGFTATLKRDTRGNAFIGYGFTPSKGISKRCAEALLREQIAEIADALKVYPWWAKLNSARIAVVTGMALNNGTVGMLHFVAMLTAVLKEDWKTAAAEIRDSEDYRSELKDRYERYAQMMELGTINLPTT